MPGRLPLLREPVLVVAFLSACSPTDQRVTATTVDTLRSGRIVVSNRGPGPSGPGAGLRLVEDLRIGKVNGGSEADVFGGIVGLGVDPRGWIYVADHQAEAIRVFDSSGGYRYTLGRKGGGPGEFKFLSGIAVQPPGVVWAMDPANARLTGFDSAGTVLSTFPRFHLGLDATIPWDGQFDMSGRLYDREPWVSGRGARGHAYVRYALTGGDSLQPQDSLRLPSVHTEYYTVSQDGITIATEVPYSPMLRTAVAPDGTVWLCNTGEYVLHRLNFQGDTLLSVKLRTPLPSVAPRERDSVAAATRLPKKDIPAVKPAVAFVMVDGAGNLWVEPVLPPEAPPAWDLFDSHGTYQGRVHSSVRFDTRGVAPVALKDGILGVVKDALGVEYVVRTHLVRDGAVRVPGQRNLSNRARSPSSSF